MTIEEIVAIEIAKAIEADADREAQYLFGEIVESEWVGIERLMA